MSFIMVKPEDEKTNKEKLEEDIAELRTRIKNTEYDLTHSFKGNSLLEQKLAISKKSLEDKEKLLVELTDNQTTKTKQIRKMEGEVTEVKNESISEAQEEIVEEEIEKEFL